MRNSIFPFCSPDNMLSETVKWLIYAPAPAGMQDDFSARIVTNLKSLDKLRRGAVVDVNVCIHIVRAFVTADDHA